MNKIAVSIDLLGLQGAQKVTTGGRECVLIDLTKCRAKPHQNGKVYLNLDVIENKDGANQWGKTHFVCEASTKEERASRVNLPIIGNGTQWGDLAEVKKQAAAPPPRRHTPAPPVRRPPPQDDDFGDTASGPISEGMEDDDIPF
ncbi:hypothetical protein [Prosthecobacter sp.]|jgi:hypothetical protein|uniref:hypothetical protein n=1 Tax=Prosthecobacter sp. TaxID=1965333 RepID=UPI0037C4FED0